MIQKNSLFTILLLVITFCSCNNKGALKSVGPLECYFQKKVCNENDNDCGEMLSEGNVVDCHTACGSGTMTCSKGTLSECNAPKPALFDICNGIDDDCDKLVDEDSEVGPCYPDRRGGLNSLDLRYGECRFGINRCDRLSNGNFGIVCKNWIEPIPEKCNGKDDNCNGTIDDGVTKNLDIIFVLDLSCSMMTSTNQLSEATAKWATKYEPRADLRFALVTLSGPKYMDGTVILEKNLSNVKDFVAVLKAQQFNNQGYQEATLDAVYDISTPSNPLGLNWSPESNKTIIIYSDENPQSYRTPEITETQAINEADTYKVSTYVFTSSYFLSTWISWNSEILPEIYSLEKTLDEIISDGSCK